MMTPAALLAMPAGLNRSGRVVLLSCAQPLFKLSPSRPAAPLCLNLLRRDDLLTVDAPESAPPGALYFCSYRVQIFLLLFFHSQLPAHVASVHSLHISCCHILALLDDELPPCLPWAGSTPRRLNDYRS